MRNALHFSEDKMLRLGTCLEGLTVLFTVAVLAFCNGQDAELASAGINIEQQAGEVRHD